MSSRRPEYLFHHNPPIDSGLSAELFFNRIDELQEAVEVLNGDLAPHIYAIHGESRSGKSHFAHRLLSMLAGQFIAVNINVNAAGTARRALVRAFFELKATLDSQVLSGLAEDEHGLLRHDIVDPWKAYFDDIELLVEERVDQAVVRTAESIKDTVTGKLGSKVAEFSQSSEATETREQTLTIKAPTERVLVLHLRELVDVIHAASQRRILIYFDDLDLLASGPPARGEQAKELLYLLGPLAENPRVAVLASMRTAFFQVSDKTLRDFIRLRRVDDHFLREVYGIHIRVLNAGQPLFDDETRDALIRMSAGRVGVFLRLCERVWRHARRKGPIGLVHLDGFLDDLIDELSRTPETAAVMGRVLEAVRNQQLELPPDGLDVEDGPLAFTLLRRGDLGAVEVVDRAARRIRQRQAAHG